MSADARFTAEILKLLLQVAWSDDEISPKETHVILEAGRSAGISAELFDLLERALSGDAPLPAPDLGFLKQRRDEALRAAQDLVTVDGHIAAAESGMLDVIRDLLDC